MAWTRRELDRCPGCGQLRSESMDPVNRMAYEAHAVKCFSCEDRELLAAKKRDGRNTEGVQIYVIKAADTGDD